MESKGEIKVVNEEEETNVFKISNIEDKITQSEIESKYGRIKSGGRQEGVSIDYWKWLSHTVSRNRDSGGGPSMIVAIACINKILERTKKRVNKTFIVSGEVHEAYVKVLEDYAREVEVINVKVKKGRKETYKKGVVVSYVIVAILWDIIDIMSALTHKVFNSKGAAEGVVVVPSLGRRKSIRKVVKKLAEKEAPLSIVGHCSYFTWRSGEMRLAGMDITLCLNMMITLKGVAKKFNIYKSILGDVYNGKHVSDVVEAMVSISRSTPTITAKHYIYDKISLKELRYLLRGLTLATLPNKKGDIRSIVINNMGISGKSLIVGCDISGIKTYHIPHSIATHLPPAYEEYPNTTFFRPSKYEKEYLLDKGAIEDVSNLKVVGRPYFQEMMQSTTPSSALEKTDVDFTFLILTQPFDDHVRDTFVNSVLTSLTYRSENRIDVVIKIHPSEKSTRYERLVSSSRYRKLDVQVTSSNLFENIASSNLSITVNSNTGLESILLGTPTICVNYWCPNILFPVYARNSVVPTVDNKNSCYEYMSTIDENCLSNLKSEQTSFAKSEYVSYDDPAKLIADKIISTQ
ncbi:hypothetical protein [Salinibacter ruber]|uniref:hypothetical protein n=1 Tax=Salinibacter ruber TaxID=146919 RepID=UPI0021680B3A|nr:hypothetical protein [Salinibacter ruber]MCS4150721.1 hypothetical protein [Salinibacter ruber]